MLFPGVQVNQQNQGPYSTSQTNQGPNEQYPVNMPPVYTVGQKGSPYFSYAVNQGYAEADVPVKDKVLEKQKTQHTPQSFKRTQLKPKENQHQFAL